MVKGENERDSCKYVRLLREEEEETLLRNNVDGLGWI